MTGRLRSLWDGLRRAIDDAMPMPPDQRAERDDDGTDRSAERKRRLKLHMLEKRGKGGYR